MPIDAGLSGIILLNDYASHITTVGSEAEKVATRAFIQNEINIVRSYTIVRDRYNVDTFLIRKLLLGNQRS